MIYDRKNKRYIKEKEYKGGMIRFLYGTKFGRVLLIMVIARPYFSRLVGCYKKSKFSRKDIEAFIKDYKIDTTEYDMANMKSFNDFFIRKRKISAGNLEKGDLPAIADAKLLVYDVTDDLKLDVKHTSYSVEEILGDKELSKEFLGGKCLVYRLTVDDYHRYHFLDRGVIKKHYKIKGELHTVRPIASKYKVYSRNCREITVMKTENFGDVVQVEVGATLVGCIKNHNVGCVFDKLQEKGHFEYGGSTILLFMKNHVILDEDILACSKRNVEVKVQIGERIGYESIH